MTLKQQFQEWHDSPTNETIAENIIDLEKIADEYAVQFRDYCNKRVNEKPFSNAGLSSEELLIIFKQENKL